MQTDEVEGFMLRAAPGLSYTASTRLAFLSASVAFIMSIYFFARPHIRPTTHPANLSVQKIPHMCRLSLAVVAVEYRHLATSPAGLL